MADAVEALTHWRSRAREVREVVRAEHTREIRSEALPENARAVLVKLASELDTARERIARLEAIIARLAIEARNET